MKRKSCLISKFSAEYRREFAALYQPKMDAAKKKGARPWGK